MRALEHALQSGREELVLLPRADRDADRVVRAEGAERAHDRALAQEAVEDDPRVFPRFHVDEVGDRGRRDGEAKAAARLLEPAPFVRRLSPPAGDLRLVPELARAASCAVWLMSNAFRTLPTASTTSGGPTP